MFGYEKDWIIWICQNDFSVDYDFDDVLDIQKYVVRIYKIYSDA